VQLTNLKTEHVEGGVSTSRNPRPFHFARPHAAAQDGAQNDAPRTGTCRSTQGRCDASYQKESFDATSDEWYVVIFALAAYLVAASCDPFPGAANGRLAERSGKISSPSW
jgi:hypothetical protein